MINVDEKVLDFLDKQKISSLTVLLADGTPHAATMHFSNSRKPLVIYFQTSKDSKKCEALLSGASTKASVVVGFSEDEWATMQMDGVVKLVSDKTELEQIHGIHYPKQPQAEKYKDDPDTVFLKFVPSWWRYTEFKPNMKVLTSH